MNVRVTGGSFDIDEADYPLLAGRTWRVRRDGYVMTSTWDGRTRGSTYLHRFLMGAPRGVEADHRDRNPRNNRRSNLRLCCHAENQHNQSPQQRQLPKGVSYRPEYGNYRAYIKVNCRFIHLGCFRQIAGAVQARLHAERLYHGEFANKEIK